MIQKSDRDERKKKEKVKAKERVENIKLNDGKYSKALFIIN